MVAIGSGFRVTTLLAAILCAGGLPETGKADPPELPAGKQGADPEVPVDWPFQFYKPEGEAHTVLRDAGVWKFTSGIGFDLLRRISYRQFLEGRQISWVEKEPADRFVDPAIAKPGERKPVKVGEKVETPYRAWRSVMKIGETYSTYYLNPESRRLAFGVLIPVGENRWFAGQVANGSVWEYLFQFDRDPFANREGELTILTRIDRPDDLDADREEEVSVRFRSDFYPDYPAEGIKLWYFNLTDTAGERYGFHFLSRRLTEDGTDIFVRTSGGMEPFEPVDGSGVGK